MTWNYRIIKREYAKEIGLKSVETETAYGIHEVYYDDDGSIKYWSQDTVAPHGETVGELKRDFRNQARAFYKPILTEGDSGKLIETTSFSDFMRELEKDAKEEGPQAVAELAALREHFRKERERIKE